MTNLLSKSFTCVGNRGSELQPDLVWLQAMASQVRELAAVSHMNMQLGRVTGPGVSHRRLLLDFFCLLRHWHWHCSQENNFLPSHWPQVVHVAKSLKILLRVKTNGRTINNCHFTLWRHIILKSKGQQFDPHI